MPISGVGPLMWMTLLDARSFHRTSSYYEEGLAVQPRGIRRRPEESRSACVVDATRPIDHPHPFRLFLGRQMGRGRFSWNRGGRYHTKGSG
jgi:hypothetical protein